MKRRLFLYLTFSIASFSLLSCEGNDDHVKKTEYRPLRIEEIGYKRELVYNSAGQVTKIVSESQIPDKDKITTVQEFEYNADGRIVTSLIDNKRLFQYTYDGDQIVKTEEFENGVASHRFVFSYQSNGLIKEMLSYKYENGAPQLTGKITYAFDGNKNISSVKEFSFSEPGYVLESMYEYDRYDNSPSVDSHFDFHSLNTGLQLHRNNPGRMVSKNKNGVAFSIEDYVYEYDANGIATKRESTITFLHIGSTGSYTTQYFFEVM